MGEQTALDEHAGVGLVCAPDRLHYLHLLLHQVPAHHPDLAVLWVVEGLLRPPLWQVSEGLGSLVAVHGLRSGAV